MAHKTAVLWESQMVATLGMTMAVLKARVRVATMDCHWVASTVDLWEKH